MSKDNRDILNYYEESKKYLFQEENMKPRGPLMVEHRLIEKMLKIASKEIDIIKKENKINSIIIDTIVDFIRTYADRTHHGKEEDILFKELGNKRLNDNDKRIMQELVDEHIKARGVVRELIEANKNYTNSDLTSIGIIINKLSFLINFYPEHILKEDKIFFPDTEKYFSDIELEKMLSSFWEFDRKMIHEKYNNLYESLKAEYE